MRQFEEQFLDLNTANVGDDGYLSPEYDDFFRSIYKAEDEEDEELPWHVTAVVSEEYGQEITCDCSTFEAALAEEERLLKSYKRVWIWNDDDLDEEEQDE